jgi:TRAP-type C4-dicarboxylate transport system substrate-binding protein
MGALTKAGEELEAIEIGLAQVGSIAAPYYAGKLPLSNWTYAVPFGPGDPKVILDATKQLYREVPELAAELGKYNQKLLIPLVIDTYNLTSKRPIVTFEDFKGVKIASIGAYHPKILSVARSSAIHMPVAERYTALQTGVIEAEFLPWDISFAYNPTTSFGSPSFTSLCLRAWTPILLGPPETSSGHCRTLIARPLRCCYPVADKGDGSVAVATMRTDGC